MRPGIIFLVFLFLVLEFPAQSKLDSLKQQLKKAGIDTNRVNLLNLIAAEIRTSRPDSSLALATKALELSEKLNFEKGIASAKSVMAICFQNSGDYAKAINYDLEALEIFRKLCPPDGGQKAASILGNIGIIYVDQANYPKAMEYYFQSLKLAEKTGNKPAEAGALSNIGVVYFSQKKYEQALDYFSRSLKKKEAAGNKAGTMTTLNNIGNVYTGQEQYAKALEFYSKSLQIARELKNEKMIAIDLINMGVVYKEMQEYNKALEFYNEANVLNKKLHNTRSVAAALGNIGVLYQRIKNYAKAEEYLKSAIRLSDSLGLVDYTAQFERDYYEVDSARGNSASALMHYKRYMAALRSIENNENTRKQTQQEMNYEFGRKEAMLKMEHEKKESVQEAELLRQKQINWFIAGCTILLLLIVVLVFNRHKLTQKNKYQKEAAGQQKKQAVAVMDAQEEERKRIAEDLHDSLGHMLSTIKLNLQMVPEGQSQVKSSLQLLDQASEEIRNITFNLMPRTLEEDGLVPALNELAAKITSSGSVKISLHVHQIEKFVLEKQSQFNIYRIIQEAVNNILKHADAKEITIQLIGQKDHLTIMIEDDGKGFDPAENKSGRGLKNIVTRSLWLKGIINIDSTPGRGTTITTEIPV
jgi:signal transduction histidine kinase